MLGMIVAPTSVIHPTYWSTACRWLLGGLGRASEEKPGQQEASQQSVGAVGEPLNTWSELSHAAPVGPKRMSSGAILIEFDRTSYF